MILVDSLQRYPSGSGSRIPESLSERSWCHMVSTIDERELHEFADQIGLRRSWAQLRPESSAAHYDLLAGRRRRALALGAREVSSRDLVRLNFDGLTRRGLLGEDARVRADLEASRLTWGIR